MAMILPCLASWIVVKVPPMTKKDLMANILENSNLPREEAEQIMESVLDII